MSDKKSKILYVDDELLNLKLFEINFRDKHTVLTAESGMNGLELLNDNPDVSVVISDMKMPEMNGLEFIRKAKIKYSYIKFYILTGFEITEEIQEAINTKLILQYFRKPFNMNKLESIISKSI